MAHELADQVALITGAGRGIGRATALRLARAGCDLALVARTGREIEAVAAAAEASGARSRVFTADVTDDAQLQTVVDQTLLRFGGISILINNAGVAPPRTMISKTVLADWDRMLATNLRAPMVLSRLLVPHMLARKRGAIVNIASIAARKPRAGEAAYAASKAGLVAFTHALFAEVRGHGIRVVALCPGVVDTGFIPPNRRVDRSKFLHSEDVAETIFGILLAPISACPTEVILEPQFDPEA